MEMEIVDVIPKTKEGDIFVMSSNFLKSLLSAPAAAADDDGNQSMGCQRARVKLAHISSKQKNKGGCETCQWNASRGSRRNSFPF